MNYKSYKDLFKRNELRHELRHEDEWERRKQAKRRHYASKNVPHTVFIKGKPWKQFDTYYHAKNVTDKLLQKGTRASFTAGSIDDF